MSAFPIQGAGVPARLPVFVTGSRPDDPEEAAAIMARRVMLLEDTLNRVCRAFNGIHARSGGELHLNVNVGGEIEFSVDRPIGDDGGGSSATLPWYASNDGTYFTANGGTVLRVRGKNNYVMTSLTNCVTQNDTTRLPTDALYRTFGVSVDVGNFACTATWAGGLTVIGLGSEALAFDEFMDETAAGTLRWPIVTILNTSGTYTKEIVANTTGDQYHIGGILMLPVYG